jgi:nucleotide-binding universal stress UspA family protein
MSAALTAYLADFPEPWPNIQHPRVAGAPARDPEPPPEPFMPYHNILVCFDLRSREAELLLRRAADLRNADGRMTVLSVIEIGTFDDSRDAVASLVEEEYNTRTAHLERLCKLAGCPETDGRVLVGKAADQIAAFARSTGCDLVVMGEHDQPGAGWSASSAGRLGSTADTALMLLECDALVVRTARRF